MAKCVNCAAICANRAKYLDMEKFVVILETKEVDSMEKLSVAIVDYCIRHSKIKSDGSIPVAFAISSAKCVSCV